MEFYLLFVRNLSIRNKRCSNGRECTVIVRNFQQASTVCKVQYYKLQKKMFIFLGILRHFRRQMIHKESTNFSLSRHRHRFSGEGNLKSKKMIISCRLVRNVTNIDLKYSDDS